MDSPLLTLVYMVLPYVVVAFAVTVYLTPRFSSPRTVWLVAFGIAAILTIGATLAMQRVVQGLAPIGSLIKAYTILYCLPAMVLTAAALVLRARLHSRWLGAITLLILAVAVTFASRYASGAFFDLVNASG